MVCMVIKKNRLPVYFSRLRDSGGTNVLGFNGQTNVNVIAELANGKLLSVAHSGRLTFRKWKAKMQCLMFAGKAGT
jgi:hypothetical protein